MTPAEVRRCYRVMRAAFARAHPRSRAARTPLVIARRACTFPDHCGARDLAYHDGRRVVLLARALRLPWQNVLGLLAHELGHAFDPTPDRPGAERRADRVAARAIGVTVRYDRNDIQTLGAGRAPRPRHLHR